MPLQGAPVAAKGKGSLARQQITQFVIRGAAKGVQDKLAPSPLVLLPFNTVLDPFEQIILAAVTAKYFRRRQGQGGEGARRTISSLSLF